MTENELEEKEVALAKEDYFELIVNRPDQASPFLQFSWCVNSKGIEELKENKVLHPFLLIVIMNKKPYGDEWEDYLRQLYPLDRGLGHIEFHRPGEYKIFASVIWTDGSSNGGRQKAADARKELYDKYKKVRGDEYRYRLHDEQTYRPDYLEHSKLPYHDQINVTVDKNLFAPEPSERLKWWVNMLWGWEKPQNQCKWRQRKYFIAFTIQPLLVFLWLILRSAIAVVWAIIPLCLGYYPNKIGWRAIIHPFDKDLDDIVDKYDIKNGNNYWWLADPNRTERSKIDKFLMSPVTAYVVMIVFLILAAFNVFYLASFIRYLDWNILFACLIFAVLLMGIFLLLCKILIYVLDRFFGETLDQRARNRWRKKQAEEAKRSKEEQLAVQSSLSFFYDQRLQPLSCANRTREATLASLPESHRSLHLRFMDLKVRVCKPFCK